MERTNVRKLVMIAMMSAISYLLLLIAFPILPAFSYLKVDFSNLPVFITMFLYGPAAGIATAFISGVLDFLTHGGVPYLIGDVAYFFATLCFTLPVYYFFKRGQKHNTLARPSTGNMLAGFTSGILLLTVFMCFANLFVLLPMYFKFSGIKFTAPVMQMVFAGILPFNLIKGVIVSIVFMIAYAKLLPWLSRKVVTPVAKS
ncbi:ECF transporter S component [Loigolactobacillus backii]|nr:ECF transporter S component [Loigolactobacillus backii]ANK60711.1 hypothetical protein AYR52_10895 [Loigolactobacillus backii]ANK65664.1 hypothetical protein AYR54_10695 [Loigolactobacillus backii]ANK68141.1 hypothetical protein AYR55_10850 [Loigolactobacillus backii]ANK69082.1 hypothetical protein AYR56_02285 [Loigolactobacillus backii]MDA5388984.1 ECF transporter S component [Loigolactobacillus backii]